MDDTEEKAAFRAWYFPLNRIQKDVGFGCCIVGILGALWVILCFNRKPIMKSIPGFIITVIALCDLVIAISNIIARDVYVDTIFYYFNGIYAFLCSYLAIVSLYIVRYQGSTAILEKYKWWAILACALLPFPLVFGTLAIIIHQPIWQFLPVSCYDPSGDEFVCFKELAVLYIILPTLIAVSAIFCSVSYWLTFRTISKAKSTQAVQLMTRMVLAYLGLTIILWITTILFFVFTSIMLEMAQGGGAYTLTFKIIAHLFVVTDWLNACRGYFHALVVSFMYSRLQGSPLWKRILLPILLVAPLITKDDLRQPPQIANNSTSTTLQCPDASNDNRKTPSSFGMQKSMSPLLPSFQRSFRKFGTFMSRPRPGMAESNASVFP